MNKSRAAHLAEIMAFLDAGFICSSEAIYLTDLNEEELDHYLKIRETPLWKVVNE